MDASKLDPVQCNNMIRPVRDALDVISGKWKLPIIVALSFGNRRFTRIAREVDGITDRMLSKELKDMEMNGLVKRIIHDSYPVVVEYALTPYSESLQPVIEALREWGVKHRQYVVGVPSKEDAENLV